MAHDVPIRGESIRLGQLLKLVGAVEGGGDVKAFLANRNVLVNGESEQRRGRQLRHGDRIEIDAHQLVVVSQPTPDPA
ncbi:MAG: RNA-binding S4 domain-containing protein [Actinomycetota bacterium]